MSMQERDYILRMIQQLAQAIGRILGLKRAGKLDEALQEVRATADGIFGPMLRTLEALDAQSAASLLGNREKIEAYAALTAEEASILELKGDAKRAKGSERRAFLLYLEAVILGKEVSDDARAAIAEIRGKVDEAKLPPRYREVLLTIGG